MNQYRLLILGSLLLAMGLLNGVSSAADSAEDQLLNNGEDFTKPINRFDMRFQYETLPNTSYSGGLFENQHQETMTFRTDLVFFSKPDQLALRFDLPIEWNKKPTFANPNGSTRFGLGDILAQAAYVHTFDSRWAGGIGLQMLLPTATSDAFGNGKWQLAPTIGVRAELPEISKGSYAGLILRQFVSVAGSSNRSSINYSQLEPQLNIDLPNQWFLITSPKIRYNEESSKWFVPLDLMVGKKFGLHWLVSVEYQYGLVRDDPHYDQWVEARVGYFF